MPERFHFEGAGDALFCGDTLIAGYRFRSDVRSHQWIGERIAGKCCLSSSIDPRFYHLDTCFCPLATDLALFYPGAFDEYGISVLRDRIPGLIEVAAEEAISFSCNAVVVGRTVILNEGALKLAADLEQRGFAVRPLRLLRVHQVRGKRKVPDVPRRRRRSRELESAPGCSFMTNIRFSTRMEAAW